MDAWMHGCIERWEIKWTWWTSGLGGYEEGRREKEE
jgi:hypothetical protein